MYSHPLMCKYAEEWTPNLFVSHAERLRERDSYGNSLLHVAARIGNSQAAEHLLSFKADPDDRNFSGETPLYLASVGNHSGVVRCLMNANCDVNSRDNFGKCALCVSAYLGQLEIVILLLHNGADVNVPDSLGNSCLHAALLKKSDEYAADVLKALLQADSASVNSMTFEGNTPLHLVATGCGFGCNTDGLETVIVNGRWRFVGLEETTNENSLSYQACVLPRLAILSTLLDNGGDVLRRNVRGETPLIRAAAAGCCHVVEKLLGRMRLDHIDLKDNYGQTALTRAAQNHHPYVVRQLLQAGASVNSRDYRGYTALHAVICGPFECLSTPVWNAYCQNQSIEELHWRDRKEIVVKVLLDVGRAQVDAADWRNETALDLLNKAPELYSDAVIEMLETRKTPGEERLRNREPAAAADRREHSHAMRIDGRGRTLLHYLTAEWAFTEFVMGAIFDDFEQNASVIEEAIKTGTKFHLDWASSGLSAGVIRSCATVKDDKGRTPLHYLAMSSRIKEPQIIPGAKNGVTACVQLVRSMLAEGSSSANVTDSYGRTPLHYAIQEELRTLLVRYGARQDVRDVDGSTPEEIHRQKATERRLNESKILTFRSIYHTEIALYATEILENAKRFPERCNLLKALRPNFDTTTTAWRIWTELDYAYRKKDDCQNYDEVDSFMKRLLSAMQTTDPLLESSHILVGSTREGTAINRQYEFDIDVILTRISTLCEVVESPVSPKGYVLLRKREGARPSVLFNEEGYLLTEQLNLRFQHVLVDVLKDGEFWKNEPAFELDLIEEVKLMAFRFSSPLCKTLKLTRVRPTRSTTTCLEISIDIVPCIYVDGWWPEEALTNVNVDLKSDGCYLVLDQPQRKFPWVPYTEPYARISFASAESGFIAKSSSAGKAAFMVCKHMLREQKGSTYLLKMSLLYCMEALGEKTPRRSSFEEVTSQELALWVRKLLQCYLHFCLLDFVPCYFMPSFLQPFEGYFRSRHTDLYMDHKFRERRRIADDKINEDPLMRAFRLYWSVCDEVTDVEFQIPVTPRPLFEEFNRKELVDSLCRLTDD